MRLTECHGHIMMDGADYRNVVARHRNGADPEAVRASLSALADAGVGYFREGGDPFGVSSLASALAPEYGVEYVSPCFAIHRRGRYGFIVGRSYLDLKEFRALLEQLKKEKAGFVKLIVSGIMSFRKFGELSCESLPAEEIGELIRIAHGEGFPVMAHVNGAEAVRACAGAESVEHAYFMDEDTVLTLAESGTVWIPTLAPVEAFRQRRERERDVAAETLEWQERMLRFAMENGVLIGCGSDSGANGVPHGAGTLKERSLLLEAGVPEEVVEKGNAEIRRRFPRRG